MAILRRLRLGRWSDEPSAAREGETESPLSDAPTWDSMLSTAMDALKSDPDRQLCAVFDEWSVEAFGRLFLVDLSSHPLLAERLPRMASPEMQRRFNFRDGAELMRSTVEIVHAMRRLYEQWSGRRLEDADVLDYGAGWGRLTRMMLQFIPDDRIHACDAMRPSVELFESLGFRFPCRLVDPIPSSLPYPADSIDFAWLWSVLTHLPEAAGDAVMRSLLQVVRPGGIVLATVRPEHFWESYPLARERGLVAKLQQDHRTSGFAHLPADSGAVWGDTSISLEYAAEHWHPWRIVATEDAASFQMKVILQRPSSS